MSIGRQSLVWTTALFLVGGSPSDAVEIAMKSGERLIVTKVEPVSMVETSVPQVRVQVDGRTRDIHIADIDMVDGKPFRPFALMERKMEAARQEAVRSAHGGLLLIRQPADLPDHRAALQCSLLADLAVIAIDTGEWDTVRPFQSWLESTAASFQRDSCSRFCLALLAHRAEQDWHRAARYYEELIELAPARLGVLAVDLGDVYISLREFSKAEALSRRALEGDPNLLMVRYNLAASLANQDRRDEAQQEFHAVLAGTPKSPGEEQAQTMARQTLAVLQPTVESELSR